MSNFDKFDNFRSIFCTLMEDEEFGLNKLKEEFFEKIYTNTSMEFRVHARSILAHHSMGTLHEIKRGLRWVMLRKSHVN